MSDEIKLLSDGDGLAVVGKKAAVERILRERGLHASFANFNLDKLGGLVQSVDAVAGGISKVTATSGPWLKLMKESAELVKEFGLTESKARGVSHAMIGDPGSISKWLQVDRSASALLRTQPSLLAGCSLRPFGSEGRSSE